MPKPCISLGTAKIRTQQRRKMAEQNNNPVEVLSAEPSVRNQYGKGFVYANTRKHPTWLLVTGITLSATLVFPLFIGGPPKKEEIEGPALEGLVMQHLRAWIAGQSEIHSLHFWRTRSGVEVDFIVYGPRGFWAIEVKNNRSISSKDVASLKSFSEEYPECTPLLLYRGKTRTQVRGILCVPCMEFLLGLEIANPVWT